MNIFSYNPNVKSYTYPIVKILVCVALIVLMINRDYLFIIERMSLNFIIGVICVCIGMASILCISLSVFELTQVHENRAKTNVVSEDVDKMSKKYFVEEIVSMVEKNDIIEIQIIEDGRRLNVGSSSDCKAGSSKFFDKMYYIGKDEFKNIEDFKKSLNSYSTNGMLPVIKIDGIKPK